MNYYLCTVSKYAGTHNDVTREVIVSKEHLDRETIKKMLKVSDERKLISIEIPRAIKVNVCDNFDLIQEAEQAKQDALHWRKAYDDISEELFNIKNKGD